jgi:hypothetical protein
MINQMRLLELVFVSIDNINEPFVGLSDVNDISRIVQYDKTHCTIIFKDGTQSLACGNLRTLTNRWIYTLDKKYHLHDDDISRPSIMIFHRPDTMGIDAGYFDSYQLKQFITALRPELLEQYSDIFH